MQAAVQPHKRSYRTVAHAFELVPKNVELIHSLARTTGIGSHVVAHNMAMSNEAATIRLKRTISSLRYGHETA
jgi:hypothetical protein